mmetsp:Transcript_19413/g.54063  ORF Transcript_19413/g.54063 Transcript_19413/m.54063 type:complete len:539 (+) Transcript_19413:43-1659(+)|eukprot:CAMPEP_0117684908 /NCGR_PEP_ID=MMETSP0804-20121206/21411_1 /TAXON_ID=1074897 /ORGANISM="Tetraselmis astigmatica, Strain CCMP880" /LENGTH=538 /DNA_ID=CAMNT_0005496053 /DNA_START=23 /DNA_END=1639 /DNA_ORIENTATION=+
MFGVQDHMPAGPGEQLTDGRLRFRKHGRLMWSKWVDVHCTLKDGRFLVCQPAETGAGGAAEPLHDIPLCGTRLTMDHHNDGDNRCFKLKSAEQGINSKLHIDEPGTLHLQAGQHKELELWIRALSRVPGVYRRPEDFYEVGKLLGTGHTCRAYACTDKFTGEQYVLKTAREAHCIEANRRMQNELEILKIGSHGRTRPPAVPLLHDHFFDSTGKTTILMELFRGGDLEVAMARKEHFTEREASNVFRQIVEGVEFLHTHGIAHRDLKPDNIMVRNREGPLDVAIGDYDLARIDHSPKWEGHTPCGTLSYMAPEIIQKNFRYTQAVDMWSLGCVLSFLLTGQHAINEDQTDSEIENDVRAHRFTMSEEEWAETIPAAARDLAAKLLCDKAEERLTASQCLQHPWLKPEDIGGSATSDEPLPSAENFRRNFSAQELHRIRSFVDTDNSYSAREVIRSAEQMQRLPVGGEGAAPAECAMGDHDASQGVNGEGSNVVSDEHQPNRRDEQIEGLKVLLKESHITDVQDEALLGQSLNAFTHAL